MSAKIFDDILLKGIRAGQVPARTAAAREWYRKQAKNLAKEKDSVRTRRGVTGESITRGGGDRGKNKPLIGNMYTFRYDPKHKATLPYYDMFPLIFPINRAKGGILGINFHYLPPALRAQLMDSLYETASNDTYDESTKLKISYNTLSAASKYRFFKPTVKHYLTSQVKSQLIYINPTEWDIALFLPTARFAGASKQKVYADSRKIAQKG
jgi:hypothetical protein